MKKFCSTRTYTLEVEEHHEGFQDINVIGPRDEIPKQPLVDPSGVLQKLRQADSAGFIRVGVDELVLLQEGESGLGLGVEA